MPSTFKRLGQSELLPRYIFAESLYARRRVLEIGAVASTLGRVGALPRHARRARGGGGRQRPAPRCRRRSRARGRPQPALPPHVFDDFEAGSFDLVMVADLAPYVRAPELLEELARLVGPRRLPDGRPAQPGRALPLQRHATPTSPSAPPTYGQLLDALTPHFSSIEVATQTPGARLPARLRARRGPAGRRLARRAGRGRLLRGAGRQRAGAQLRPHLGAAAARAARLHRRQARGRRQPRPRTGRSAAIA